MSRRLVAVCLIVVAGCIGGGDGLSAESTGPVRILTQGLDRGNVGHSFFQQLAASGGKPPYSWWISSTGDGLPAGLDLTAGGAMAGVPAEAASRSVVVVCQDAESALDLVTLSLEVRDVQIDPGAPGNVVPGSQLAFQATGGTAGYTFSMVANRSGASLSAGGLYTAGTSSGVDVIRATDLEGFFDEIGITVGDNPFVGFQAVYGTTDVWWLDWDVVYSPNPTYATDFDEVLVALGLRDAASTDVAGTEADELAKLLVMRRTLGHLSTYFGNSFDGTALGGGLAISFVGPIPPSTGTTPPAGGVWSASSNRYNTICVRHGPNANVVGTAWLDPSNDSIEHNCGDPMATPLGIFANRLLPPYLNAYNNSIASDPVSDPDVDGLREMLYGNPPANGREQEILDVADGFGRTLAAVLAHEIGHSLGLQHPPVPVAGDIMAASLTIGPGVDYSFSGSDWAILFTDLPGPNR